ncbi:fructosamine kinase [Haloarcula sp. CBA1130]|uniref:fructosamine kinase family protein n=1 Tax=unclassified Haloarcula TaxID=2624677 RepID=UPI0012464D10|nr:MULTISPECIES: fructosamine kinase family protein [unclassified Haloarcula]KAA9395855.1 fructosamine kinase [Haloarcula sp. CBA1129]KAA9400215.1 fructosamine kinase [Haloarcula sp. CBA1130]
MDEGASAEQETATVLQRVSSVLSADARDALELDGGEVGSVYRVSFRDRSDVAAKVDDSPLGIEAAMLQYLDRNTPLPVPKVLHVEPELLVMSFIGGDDRFDERAERDLARHVASLHDISADAFGFPFDTLSGPFSQSNPWTDSWIDFFRERRLLPFATAARNDGVLPATEFDRVQRLADTLDTRLVEPATPSLLHGDIHPGNAVVADGTVRAVLDPAIYFGHAEVDLAYVSRLESIGDAFFDEYCRHRDISAGYFEERRDVYVAFHALENVRFFGDDGLPRLDSALDRLGV